MIKGDTYKERIQHQLDEWVKGNAIHNDVDDECCPDFSCCNPELLQEEDIRIRFRDSDAISRDSMLVSFLGIALDHLGVTEKVYVTGASKSDIES